VRICIKSVPFLFIQKSFDVAFVLALLAEADMSCCDPALPIDDDSGWHGFQPAEQISEPVIAKHYWIVDLLRIRIRADNAPALFVESNPENDEVVITICLLKPDEHRNFNSARRTPRRPEVQQHHVAAKLG